MQLGRGRPFYVWRYSRSKLWILKNLCSNGKYERRKKSLRLSKNVKAPTIKLGRKIAYDSVRLYSLNFFFKICPGGHCCRISAKAALGNSSSTIIRSDRLLGRGAALFAEWFSAAKIKIVERTKRSNSVRVLPTLYFPLMPESCDVSVTTPIFLYPTSYLGFENENYEQLRRERYTAATAAYVYVYGAVLASRSELIYFSRKSKKLPTFS